MRTLFLLSSICLLGLCFSSGFLCHEGELLEKAADKKHQHQHHHHHDHDGPCDHDHDHGHSASESAELNPN